MLRLLAPISRWSLTRGGVDVVVQRPPTRELPASTPGTPVLSSFLVGTPTWRTIYVDPPGNSIRVVSQEDVRPIGTGLRDRSLELRVLCLQLSALPSSSFPSSSSPSEAFRREDSLIRGSGNRLAKGEKKAIFFDDISDCGGGKEVERIS